MMCCVLCGDVLSALWVQGGGVAGTPVPEHAKTSVSSGIKDYDIDERWVCC